MRFFIIGIAIIIGGILLFVRVARAPETKHASLFVGNTYFFVAVADTPRARMQGLSGHTQLAEREGMLFVFSTPRTQSFWMKGMLFPLDFIWINNGRVVGVTENALPINETGYRVYRSEHPVNWVLEVNAGMIKKFGIKVGDAVY